MANRFLSNIRINDAYTFPASDGTNGQILSTDGSGSLSFIDPNTSTPSLSQVLTVGNTSGANDIIIADNQSLSFGDDEDLSIQYNSAGDFGRINNKSGHLYIQNSADNSDIIFRSDDGAGGLSTYFQLDGGESMTKVFSTMRFSDDVQLRLGTSSDLRIYHDATISLIQNFTGNLEIRQSADDKDIIFYGDDMSGGITPYFRIDGSEGFTKIHREMRFLDDVELRLGFDGDMRIYHDENNSYVRDVGNGNLYLDTNGSFIGLISDGSFSNGKMGLFYKDSAVELYYNNSKKFETTSTGVTVTGQITSGRLNITDVAVPIMFTESGNTGTGKYWRQVLDGGDIRFDVDTTSTNGNGSFSSYNALIQLNADGHTDINGALDVGGDVTVGGGDLTITKQNDAPTMTLLHDGTNPSTNDLLFKMQFQSDYDGSHQNWGKIEVDTNASSVRTNMDFYVKSASGNEQLALRLEGQPSATPKTYIYGDLVVEGNTTTLNTQTVEVEDNILQLNTTQGSPDTATAATSGISIYRGDGVTQASFIFDDDDDTWDLTNKLKVDSYIEANNLIVNNGNILQLHVDAWNSGQTDHYVLYNGWTTNTGDYLIVKSSGNQNGGNGAILIGDGNSGRVYFGKHGNQSAAVDSATAPLDTTYAYIGGSANYFSANTTFAGNLGVGVSPETKFHVQGSDTGGVKTNYSTVLIEQTDAQLDLLSTSAGTWGSALNFVESAGGNANTDVWSIARKTTSGTGDSSLNFNFGTNNQHNNTTRVSFSSGGNITANTGTSHSFLTGNTENLSTADTTGFRLHQSSYTDGRYTHRFRKRDKGGGVPLYLDFSSGTANVFSNLIRFGKYTGESIDVEVNGKLKATHFHGDGSNLTGVTVSNADTVDNLHAASFLRSDADDSFSGGLVSTARDEGIFGTYNSNKTDHIWSMGTSYKNAADGSDFGNLYGLAYKHTNNTTGGTMAGGHQAVWVANGNAKSAMGNNLWTSGGILAASGEITGTFTMATPVVGSSAKIQFQNNDFIRYDDVANAWHFDVDGGTSNGTLQAANYNGTTFTGTTFAGNLDGTFESLPVASFFTKGADIGGSVNLNNYTTPGYFHQNSNSQATSGSNYPANVAGMLTVTADGVMVYQTYQGYASHGTYERKYYNGTWESWHLIYDSGTFTNNSSNWNVAYNDKINSAGFNTGNGVLTLTQQDGGTVTVDLDGRYSTGEADTLATVTGRGATTSSAITITNDTYGIFLRTATSGAGSAIRFSDQQPTSSQTGDLRFYHSDSSSAGSSASFHFQSSEPQLSIVAGDADTTGKFYSYPQADAGEVDFGWAIDTDTGMYRPAANQVGLVAGGSRKLLVSSTGVTVQNGVLNVPSGSATAPSIGVGDTDTGFYDSGSNAIGISSGGVKTAEFQGDGSFMLVGGAPTISLLDTTSSADDFYLHVNSNNFYILCDRDGTNTINGGWDSPHPLQLEGDTNIGYLFGSRMFADNYHPNADAWTTARTITLSGDLNGSVSMDGSANVTLSAQVVNGSHTHDDRYYTESEMQSFFNRGYINKHNASNLPVGWYTIATNTGDRALGEFQIWDTASSDHQSVLFSASHHFGTDSSNDITVLANSRYSGTNFRYIRIKEGGTYDGAVLQVYVDGSSNSCHAAIVGGNAQESGWVLKDWIADGTDPGDVSSYNSMTERIIVDLDKIINGGIMTTGEYYATNNRVFHDGYHPNADAWTTSRTISLTGEVTGSVTGVNGSGNISISTTVSNTALDDQYVDVTGDTMTGNLLGRGLSPTANITYDLGTTTNHYNYTHSRYFQSQNTQSRTKVRVWSGATYGIGMQSGYTFGSLGGSGTGAPEYAQTFQTSNTANRGWWFGDTSHSNAQGAFCVTTTGRANLAHSLRIAYGESDTTQAGTYRLDVGGNVRITNGLAMTNSNITGVNHIVMNDAGVGEGIQWAGGNNWYIQECPDNMTNAGGNLQFSTGTTRRVTMTTGGTLNATGDVIAYSDRRVKDNIQTIDNALDTVSKLRGVSYNRNDVEDKSKKIGVIAQEVEDVLPEVVQYSKDADVYSVAYGNMAGLFIEAIKELKTEVLDLKAEIKKLKNK